MPTPDVQNETRREWIDRCIPVVIRDGTTDRQDQAVAICISKWTEALKPQNAKKKKKDDWK